MIMHARSSRKHVLEPLSGYLLLAEKLWENGPEYAEGWNFGPNDNDARPVSWIADRLTAMWGEDAGWKRSGEEHPHEATFLKLDSSKARGQIGWHPRWNLESSLKDVNDWYRSYGKNEGMRGKTINQIRSYQL